MTRPPNVGCPKSVPDSGSQRKQTANASSQEEKCMPVPNAQQFLEENPDLEAGPFGGTLSTAEAAKHLKVYPRQGRLWNFFQALRCSPFSETLRAQHRWSPG